MKTILFLFAAATLASCYSHKELQVQMINAELVRIDTVARFPDYQQVLTWKGSDNQEYVSFESLSRVFVLGTRMPVLRAR